MTSILEQVLYSLNSTADDCAEESNHDRANLLRACVVAFDLHSISIAAEREAWRQRFPQYEYRAQDDCVALRLTDALAAL